VSNHTGHSLWHVHGWESRFSRSSLSADGRRESRHECIISKIRQQRQWAIAIQGMKECRIRWEFPLCPSSVASRKFAPEKEEGQHFDLDHVRCSPPKKSRRLKIHFTVLQGNLRALSRLSLASIDQPWLASFEASRNRRPISHADHISIKC
jgi:hypothetical protein